MDYMNILLEGITTPAIRPYFAEYLIREFKKSETLGYSRGEFFHGLKTACTELRDELARCRAFLNGVVFELDEDFQQVFSNTEINLIRYTGGRFSGFLREPTIEFIRDCIDEAERLTSSTAPTPEPVTTPAPQTFPDYLNFEDPKKREGLAEAIREIMRYKDPKDWAALFIALRETNKLIEKHRFRSPMYRIMKAYFGDNIGHPSGFMSYTKEGLDYYEKQQDKTMARLIKEYIDKIENLEF